MAVLLALAGIGLGSVALARSSAGPTPPAPPVPPDYREAVVAPQRPLTLDPLLAGADAASGDLRRLLYRNLLRLDDRGQPVPDLAASWGVSGDGLHYRFAIDPSAAWSTGSPVTASDVVATVAAVQVPDFPDARLAAEWKGLTAAVEGDSVVVTLPAPRASFGVAASDLPVVPEAVARTPLADLLRTRTRPLPTDGTYRVRTSDAKSVVVEPNPQTRMQPHLRVLELELEPDFDTAARALANRQVDALEATTPSERSALAKLSGVTLHDSVSFRFVDLILNARRPGLDDVAVRKAIASAVNRHTIIEGALDGAARPQVDAEPAGIAWLGPQPAEDPEPQLAARALDAAGWAADPKADARHRGGISLSFTLTVPSTPPLPQVADELSAQLAEVGIAVNVVPVSEARFDSAVLQAQSFDLALADWDSGPDPDLSMFWRSNAKPPHGENVSGTALDLFLDRALDDLATETDPQLRQSAAGRVEQRLADEVPAVFLYAPVTSFATRMSLTHVAVPAVGRTGSRYDGVDEWRPAAGP